MTSQKISGNRLIWLTKVGKPYWRDNMELKDIKNPILFVDYTINRAKIVLSDGRTKVIRFRVFKDEFDTIVFEIFKQDEKYCV
jgi:hypothetical protein